MFYNRPMTREQLSLDESRRTFERPGFYGQQMNQMSYLPYRTPVSSLEHHQTHNAPWSNWNRHVATPPADILELDEQFIIELALPGVVLDDVQLKIEGNVLTICAKRTPTLFEERATVLQRELPVVYLVRHFEFDTRIMCEQVEARLDRGILYISIPKLDAAIRIPVSAGMAEQFTNVTSAVKSRVNAETKVPVKG
ncbi:MAG: Hsp20/alpha crystallin family protein [Candidatus Obscuribacterales bacterium]|nr:Hsp20/alpha crystallin family protein [Candidatus Obscuribacterales bacterium]